MKLLSFRRGILIVVASHTFVVVLSDRFLLSLSSSWPLLPPLASPFVASILCLVLAGRSASSFASYCAAPFSE